MLEKNCALKLSPVRRRKRKKSSVLTFCIRKEKEPQMRQTLSLSRFVLCTSPTLLLTHPLLGNCSSVYTPDDSSERRSFTAGGIQSLSISYHFQIKERKKLLHPSSPQISRFGSIYPTRLATNSLQSTSLNL